MEKAVVVFCKASEEDRTFSKVRKLDSEPSPAASQPMKHRETLHLVLLHCL